MRKEEWRSIPGIPTYYEVSDLGRLRSLARIDARGWRIQTRIMSTPHAEVTLSINGKLKWFPLAFLILTAFVGPKPSDCRLARHLDDDRSNNKPSNLAWGNDLDNVHDALRNGRSFASYGHLGKKHSVETRQLLSAQRKGIATGRSITETHKVALLQGYRKKFPIKEQPASVLCACGCKRFANPGRVWLRGHAANAKRWGYGAD